MPKKALLPRHDSLQAGIKALVAQLAQLKHEKRIYVELVKLGLAYQDTIAFRRRLVLAGLPAPRASEIAAILGARDRGVPDRFIAGLSVRDALAEARGKKSGSAGDKSTEGGGNTVKNPREIIGDALEKLMDLMGAENPWSLDCGLIQLRFMPTRWLEYH